MKIWLFVNGPERILAWAAGKDPRIEWENRYAHHCHACLTLLDDSLVRDTIRNHYQERIDDVLMRYMGERDKLGEATLHRRGLADTVADRSSIIVGRPVGGLSGAKMA